MRSAKLECKLVTDYLNGILTDDRGLFSLSDPFGHNPNTILSCN